MYVEEKAGKGKGLWGMGVETSGRNDDDGCDVSLYKPRADGTALRSNPEDVCVVRKAYKSQPLSGANFALISFRVDGQQRVGGNTGYARPTRENSRQNSRPIRSDCAKGYRFRERRGAIRAPCWG